MNEKGYCKNKIRNLGFIKRNCYLYACCIVFCLFAFYSRVNAEPEQKEMILTCYCPESCAGTITATGKKVRKGICAVDKKHLGATALIWTADGEFIGFFECEDTGGKAIQSGNYIDVWMPSLDEATEFITEYGSNVIVQFVWAEG